MTAYRTRICAVALLIAPVVSACGSGGDDGRASGAKGGYVDQVDPICTELQGQVGDLGQDPAKQAQDVEAAVMRIKAVSLPREDDERARLYIAAMENLFLSLQAVDQGRRVNDSARAERGLTDARMNNETAAKAAKEYGMVECAKPL